MTRTAEDCLSEFRATSREECGILVGVVHKDIRIITNIILVKNVADDPENDYAILASDLALVEANLPAGKAAVGFFHTHTERHTAHPSENDRKGAELFPEFLNLVFKPSTGERAWYSADK